MVSTFLLIVKSIAQGAPETQAGGDGAAVGPASLLLSCFYAFHLHNMHYFFVFMQNTSCIFRECVLQYIAIDLKYPIRKEVKLKMKQNIHPDYQETTITCACGNVIKTRSTKKDIKVEICSKCHPFFTGKQKLVDTSGRVDMFKKRYGLQDK